VCVVTEDAYCPGERNIDAGGRWRRLAVGGLSLVAAGGIGWVVASGTPPAWTALLVAAPLFVAALGVLQAGRGFCVALAFAGEQAAGAAREPVADPEARAADRAAARRSLLVALGVAAAGALLLYWVVA
jgi:hypothetical protein